MSAAKTKLLIVDDDNALRHLLSIILRRSGYEIRSANDGFSALAAIREEMPDVLLSDLYMPGMSGFELLSVVRRRFPMIPVIAMSSAYPGHEVPDGIAADAFYEKATDLDALLGLVHGVHYLPQAKPGLRKMQVPVWVGWSVDGRDDKKIVLSCPECLRTFSQARTESSAIIHEALCLYCSTTVLYALVKQTNHSQPEKLLPVESDSVQDIQIPY
jgi:DNA-binding NtrC family response regulator